MPGLALILLRPLRRGRLPTADVLQQIFALGDAEAAVALCLMAGATAADVAKACNVALDTVRTQVRAVLCKTDAANLRELGQVFATLAA